MTKIKLMELCTGTGAFTLAAQHVGGFEVVCANDFVEESERIYKANFPDHKFINRDIHELTESDLPEEIDILTAGFPCQPFSLAGEKRGFEDSRSNVFWKILDIIDLRRPKVVLLENVKNLQSHDNGNTFKVIVDSIKERGYTVNFRVIDTSEITGLPHVRERIFIVCTFLIYQDIIWPTPSESKTPLSEIFDKEVDDKYYYTPNSSKIYDTLAENVTKTSTVYQYRRYYVRENKSGVCPTLTANMGTGGHNVPIILTHDGRIRKLTPRECFRLQGFPDSYILPASLSDSRLYKLAGNAVTVGVVERLFKEIRRLFES